MQKYKLDSDAANSVTSLIYIISASTSPFMGFVVDKVGKNVTWIFISILTTMLVHSLLAFTTVNPYLCMICMGLSYSMLASSLWPLIALVVPENQLGTAYGM